MLWIGPVSLVLLSRAKAEERRLWAVRHRRQSSGGVRVRSGVS